VSFSISSSFSVAAERLRICACAFSWSFQKLGSEPSWSSSSISR
jgi:hypothetical protein